MTSHLQKDDTVIFLLSGGGSALFEKPLVTGEELQSITSQLLHSGADIVEMNTIRKRLSGVKGSRFAKWCEPAQVKTIVLSDILGDTLDMIASGPTDAAGGYVDGESFAALQEAGLSYEQIMNDNDAYHGLQAIGGLIITGPTGTNVNDISIVLIDEE